MSRSAPDKFTVLDQAWISGSEDGLKEQDASECPLGNRITVKRKFSGAAAVYAAHLRWGQYCVASATSTVSVSNEIRGMVRNPGWRAWRQNVVWYAKPCVDVKGDKLLDRWI
jgi:hypothetical protein